MGSLNPTFIPKTITQFLQQLSTTTSVSDKIIKLDDLVTKLQIEMRKIDAFRRELPLCMLLVNDAVVALKEEAMVIKKLLKSDQPVFEEFMPIKKICDEEKSGGDKKNWLSSTQLWNANDDVGNSNQDKAIKKRGVQEDDATMKDSYRQFGNIDRGLIPLKGCNGFAMVGTRREKDRDELRVSGLSLIAPGRKNAIRGNNLVSETSPDRKAVPSSINDQLKLRTGVAQGPPPQQETSRKQRRCWSTDLHRRFVNALQQLGGSQVATPKQIRELMQVNNLTNDEVKSHLQKYRLHTRRHPSANQSSGDFGGGLGISSQDHYVESSKHGISQSGSPDGPLLIGTSTTGGDSIDDGEDSNSENYCWKGV